MIDFVIWTIFIGVGICAAVFLVLAVCIIISIVDMWRKRMSLLQVLPPPDKAAERTFSQRYFERAIGRRDS
jgi:uncharacterized iron-regulated membrane protein